MVHKVHEKLSPDEHHPTPRNCIYERVSASVNFKKSIFCQLSDKPLVYLLTYLWVDPWGFLDFYQGTGSDKCQ